MRKFLLVLMLLITGLQSAMAVNVKVEAMSDFSTANPPKTWQVKIVETSTMKNGNVLNSGSIIEGKIEDVKAPARLKRDASFVFVPTTYFDVKTQSQTSVKKDFMGKYNSKGDIDVKNVATESAIFVGNQLANGVVGPAIGLIQGVVKNEEGNRVKSAAKGIYNRTPLSYASKGSEIEIKQGQIFVMKFKEANNSDDIDKPNYHYTID